MLWFSVSGLAAMTVSRARRSPWKSGMSTSILQSGSRFLTWAMHWANMNAPPSVRSSRFTDVMTA